MILNKDAILKVLQKYQRRMLIVEDKVSTAPDSEIELWRWLRIVLKKLGSDGMSSDESTVEDDIEIVYKTKQMAWRRNLDKEMDLIDAQRIRELNPFAKQGSKPVRRFRNAGFPVSTRPPVAGLPRCFYDDGWFLGRDKRQKQMRISTEKFRWMKII